MKTIQSIAITGSDTRLLSAFVPAPSGKRILTAIRASRHAQALPGVLVYGEARALPAAIAERCTQWYGHRIACPKKTLHG